MSAWKRTALEKLPEYRSIIEEAESPMALWIELHQEFENSYKPGGPDDDLVRRFFEFARWCMQTPNDGPYLSDVATASVCAFYEHLPQNTDVRRDLRRWLSREEFINLREAFRYHLSESEFKDFETEFLKPSGKGKRR